MRLILDSAASDGEALNALSKLRHSLVQSGPDPHELVDALENAGFAEKEESTATTGAIETRLRYDSDSVR